MGEETKIQWTHHTFNPWIGCAKVHTGCKGCYAEAQDARWGYTPEGWGVGKPRKVTSASNWAQPKKWVREAAKAGERRRVFCASLADVLDAEAPTGAQGQLWDLIRATAQVGAHGEHRAGGAFGLDWLLLTKRPERWEVVPEDVRPLVWLGTSISDQETADTWVPRLMQAQGFRLRFLSLEPMVGPVALSRWLPSSDGFVADPEKGPIHRNDGADFPAWVIVGGESGTKSRPCNVDWVRRIQRDCASAGVPCFVKQLGARPEDSLGSSMMLDDAKGGTMTEWPADIRVREFPR